MKIHYMVWLLLSAIPFAAGEYLSKKFAIAPSVAMGVKVIAVYSLCSLLWLPAIATKNSLAIAGTIWSVVSLITTVFMGSFIFGEPVTPIQYAGIALALAACVLLNI